MDALMTVEMVRKQLHVARSVVYTAMQQYLQTGGEIGLRSVKLGKQSRTRASWVDDWIEREADRKLSM